MGFKQHISRTWQMIEQQVNDVPFRPDNEVHRQVEMPKKRDFPCDISIENTRFTTNLLQIKV